MDKNKRQVVVDKYVSREFSFNKKKASEIESNKTLNFDNLPFDPLNNISKNDCLAQRSFLNISRNSLTNSKSNEDIPTKKYPVKNISNNEKSYNLDPITLNKGKETLSLEDVVKTKKIFQLLKLDDKAMIVTPVKLSEGLDKFRYKVSIKSDTLKKSILSNSICLSQPTQVTVNERFSDLQLEEPNKDAKVGVKVRSKVNNEKPHDFNVTLSTIPVSVTSKNTKKKKTGFRQSTPLRQKVKTSAENVSLVKRNYKMTVDLNSGLNNQNDKVGTVLPSISRKRASKSKQKLPTTNIKKRRKVKQKKPAAMCKHSSVEIRSHQNKSVVNNNDVSVNIIREWLNSAEK